MTRIKNQVRSNEKGGRAMNEKTNEQLTPADMRRMKDEEFQERFGFVPTDKLEREFFIATGKKLTQFQRALIEAGLLDWK
jgi:hypothetical protein